MRMDASDAEPRQEEAALSDPPPSEPALPRARAWARGSNHVGMRQFNERVVLQAIRVHGSCSKAEIARSTHLTAQTVQQIIGRLEADGLVVKRGRVRGRIGQPSVPMALNADGAYAIGLTIGRRNAEVLLVDFCAKVRRRLNVEYTFPDPATLFERIGEMVSSLLDDLGPAQSQLLCGIGVAAPLSLEAWQGLLGFESQARSWQGIDIRARVEQMFGMPVRFIKDTSAACVAELVIGRGHDTRDFLYLFMDTFIGGGLVLNNQLQVGLHGNAGAVGSLPVRLAVPGQQERPEQLLGVASLHQLQAAYREAGLDPLAWRDQRALQAPWREHTLRWIDSAAGAIALAIHNVICLLDIDNVIMDGSFSEPLRDALLARLPEAMDGYDWQGVVRPRIHPGAVGADARALGAALLPLYAEFMPSPELFLKALR